MQTICEKNGVTVKRTGRDYDFIATVENDNDEAVEVDFNGDYEYELEPFVIPPHDWVGITGWRTLEAFENGCFEISRTDEY